MQSTKFFASRARLEKFCTHHRIFVLRGMANCLTNRFIFRSMAPLYPPGWVYTRILYCQIFFLFSFFKNFTAGEKKIVPCISLLGEKIVPCTCLPENNCTRQYWILLPGTKRSICQLLLKMLKNEFFKQI